MCPSCEVGTWVAVRVLVWDDDVSEWSLSVRHFPVRDLCEKCEEKQKIRCVQKWVYEYVWLQREMKREDIMNVEELIYVVNGWLSFLLAGKGGGDNIMSRKMDSKKCTAPPS